MYCVNCNGVIPVARLEVLPDTQTCLGCSTAKPVVGVMDWAHKTAPERVMINSADKENLRRAKRISARSR